MVSRIRRRRGACTACRERKLRCNGERPCCENCSKSDVDCEYTSLPRRVSSSVPRLRDSSVKPSSQVYNTGRTLGTTSNWTMSSKPQDTFSHHRTLRSVDSAIGNCDFLFTLPQQGKASSTANERYPTLSEIYKDISAPQYPPSVPIRYVLHALRQRSQEDLSLPSEARQLQGKLLSKVEYLVANFHEAGAVEQDGMAISLNDTPLHYIKALQERSSLGNMYINPQKIEQISNQAKLGGLSAPGVEKALLYATLSMACKCIDGPGNVSRARKCYEVAANLAREVIWGRPSISKLQVLVTMLLFTMNDDAATDNSFLLLSNAINMVQALNLRNVAGIRALQDEENESYVRNLVWILFSIGGILCMRYGRPSMLKQESIRFPPTRSSDETTDPSKGKKQDYFDVFCELGHICTIVSDEIFNASKRPEGNVTSKLMFMLNDWHSNIEVELRSDHSLSSWYYEAVFTLLFASTRLSRDLQMSDGDNCLFRSHELPRLARELLKVRSLTHYPFETSFSINILMIAWYIVFSAITAGLGEKDDLALLSIVSALFARLSLRTSIDCGFYEISQLGAMAHSLLTSVSTTNIIRQPSFNIQVESEREFRVDAGVGGADDTPESRFAPGTVQSNETPDFFPSSESDYPSHQSSELGQSPAIILESWRPENLGNFFHPGISLDQSWDEDFQLLEVGNDFRESLAQPGNPDLNSFHLYRSHKSNP